MANYYVATDGNDSNDGSLESPWATPEYGADQLSDGDTLYLRGGTYNVVGSTDTTALPIEAEVDNITIRNYPDEIPIIDGGTGPDVGMVIGTSRAGESLISSQTFKGLTIKGCIFIGWNTSNCIIEECNISEGGSHRPGENFQDCISIRGTTNVVIRNCTIHDNHWTDGIGVINHPLIMEYDTDTATIEHNEVYNSVGPGIRLKDDPINIHVRYNYIYNCTPPETERSGARPGGILVGGQAHNGARNNEVYQNIIRDCFTGIAYLGLTENFKAYNNTLVNNERNFWYIDAMTGGFGWTCDPKWYVWNNISYSPNNTFDPSETFHIDSKWGESNEFEYCDYNLFFSDVTVGDRWRHYDGTSEFEYTSLNDWQNATGLDTNSAVADPQFIDANGTTPADFKLQTGSSAWDAGIDRQDYDGDGNTTESLTIGAYITGTETIGLTTTSLSAPSQIQCEGEANPTNVTDTQPEFRAYVTPIAETDAGAITKIQIQVDTTSDFSNTELTWDSGMVTLNTPVDAEGWTEQIEYGSS